MLNVFVDFGVEEIRPVGSHCTKTVERMRDVNVVPLRACRRWMIMY